MKLSVFNGFVEDSATGMLVVYLVKETLVDYENKTDECTIRLVINNH